MTAHGGARPLGRRLCAWREAQCLSLAAAARRLGVHPSTYQRWEEGRRPYPRHLATIADVLGSDLPTVTALAGPAPRRPGRPAPPDASALMRARLATGLNRVELGRLLHTGPATVYQWERGRARPPSDLLARLAACLDLTREALDDALADHPPSRHDGEVLPGLGAALRRRGWARAGVQDLLGVASTTVFEWETGRTRTPGWALRRLADAVGTELDDLVSAGRRTEAPARATTLGTLRKRARMTQREAAAVLGVSAATLGRSETGRRPISLPLARAMAQVYRVPLSRVLAVAGLTPPPMLRTPQWTPEQLPALLADLRQGAGLSKSQVARCAGVSHPTVHRWETGESTPSPRALATLEVQYQLGRGRLTALAVGRRPRGEAPTGCSAGPRERPGAERQEPQGRSRDAAAPAGGPGRTIHLLRTRPTAALTNA